MNKNIILIFSELAFLVAVFFIGTPFEFLNVTVCVIAFYFALLFILCLFILLFRQIKRIESKFFKRLSLCLLTIMSIFYFMIGVWDFIIFSSSHPPMWEDVIVYTNDKNEKVIRQFRKTSGSIYDYRDRKIIADFGQFRISFDCNANNLKGIWTEYDITMNKKIIKNFDDKETLIL